MRHFWWLMLVVVTGACGSPNDKKGSAKDDVVVICDDPGCEDDTALPDTEGCGFATCDDQNDCTIDSGGQDSLTCVASCTYETAAECAVGPGEELRCSRSCRAPVDACMKVTQTADVDGCVIACEFSPLTVCQSGDGCCPSGCNNAIDADCAPATDATPTNPNTHPISGGACDPNVEGVCPNTTPYCLDGACRECVGAGDCAEGDLCIDGGCTAPPNCAADPGVCPDGYSCTDGRCKAPVGAGCDPNQPTSCPSGLFCDPTTNSCANAGGDAGCGFCNPDCTCDGNLTCDGFFCSGCSSFDPSLACAEGMLCLEPLMAICLPLG